MQAEEQTTVTNETQNKTERPKWLVPVVAIAALVIVVILGVSIKNVLEDQQQQKLLYEELNQLNELSTAETVDYEAVNAKLTSTVTSGDYVVVEKAMKAYMADVVAVSKSMEEAMNTPAIVNALSPDNLAADAPEFTETKTALDAAYKTLVDGKAEFQSLMTEERIMSYLTGEVDAKYVEIYKEFASGMTQSQDSEWFGQVTASIDQIVTTIEIEQEALDFLIKNKGRWEVEDGQIFLKTDKLVSEYSAIIAPLFN